MKNYQVNKIEDYAWEIPRSEGMNVPVKIYSSEKLIEQIKEGRTIQQIVNATSLPGIVRSAYVMPDGHEGYGFPIGGVAAFNDEDGIVSPGGVGYDINCLPGNSKILDQFGANHEIESFVKQSVTVSYQNGTSLNQIINLKLKSLSGEGIINSDAEYVMHRMESNTIFELDLLSGHKIRATAEHPIRTKRGMVPISELKKEDEIAVSFFEGVEFEPLIENVELNQEYMDEYTITELRKSNLYPINYNVIPIITKLYGYLLGDGSIHKSKNDYVLSAYGKEEDLIEIKKDIEQLGFSARIYERNREHKINTKYGEKEFTTKNYELHTSSNSLARLFLALGFPLGKKTNQDFSIPNWIMENKLWIKRLFLAGFFGAEMSTPKTSSKTCFMNQVLTQVKNESNLNSGKYFMIQINELLNEFNIPSKFKVDKEHVNKQGKTYRLSLWICNEDKLSELFGKINFEYNKKRKNMSEIVSSYIKYKKNIIEHRDLISQKVKEYKNRGFNLNEITKLLTSEKTNSRFIERAYYEKNHKPRVAQNILSFEEYYEIKKKEIEDYGIIFEKISNIKSVPYEGKVYDFTIKKTHNFFANGVLVSNCGVRMIRTNLNYAEVEPKLKELVNSIFNNCPSGVGSKGKLRLNNSQLDEVLVSGVKWAIENGYGWKKDLDRIEEDGCIEGADPDALSDLAMKRGRPQLGTVGAGNHFMEIQEVNEIMNEEIAKKFGLFKGQLVIMIHMGSRGLGHQVASDYIRSFTEYSQKNSIKLVDRELVYAPVKSRDGENYIKAMNSAVNYAFTNRQLLTHWVRESFSKVLDSSPEELGMDIIYDVAHNIAKREKHVIDFETMEKDYVWVHRKGATRAMPKNRSEISQIYRDVGQPVLIPGSMGTASYILCGTEKSAEPFHSVCHGAGRVMSRHQAISSLTPKSVRESLQSKGIYIKTEGRETISEEAPEAYKNIDEVINSVRGAGLADVVAKMIPKGVVKG